MRNQNNLQNKSQNTILLAEKLLKLMIKLATLPSYFSCEMEVGEDIHFNL